MHEYNTLIKKYFNSPRQMIQNVNIRYEWAKMIIQILYWNDVYIRAEWWKWRRKCQMDRISTFDHSLVEVFFIYAAVFNVFL